MKIGILTYFGARNYGAFLQAYAVREIVKNYTRGTVELINYRTLKEVETYNPVKLCLSRRRNNLQLLRRFLYDRLQFRTFEKSVAKYQILSEFKLISDSVEDFADFVKDRYDLIIVGSDEIWKTDGFRPFPNAYWLPDVQCKKMAYAVSSRNSIDKLSDDKKSLIKKYIKDFDYIGIRDKLTFDLIAGLSSEPDKCHLNCDPTFLCNFPADIENGKRILRNKFRINPSKNVIGIMFSDPQYGQKIIQTLTERYNSEFEVASLSSLIDGAKNYGGLTPFEWIDVIAACDMIISSRFHGVVFSIKNSRPFLAVEMDGSSKDTSKLFDLLDRNGLTQFYVENGEDISNVLFNIIPKFIESVQQQGFKTDYSNIIASEQKMAESFFSRLNEFI